MKLSGPIAKEYAELTKKIKGIMHDSTMQMHITNLGYLLQSRGIIKKPQHLYGNIEADLIRAIINARIREK